MSFLLKTEFHKTTEIFDQFKFEKEPYQREEKKIILLLGEGNFSFTKSLIENKTYPDHLIIATDLNDSLSQDDSEYLEDFLGFEGLDESLFIKFGVDATKLDWPGLVKELLKQEKIQNPDIIQFNFPWRPFDSEFTTHQIVRGVFEAASGLLDAGGLLKMGLVNKGSKYYCQYDLDSCLDEFKDRFKDVSQYDRLFTDLYPGYKHASSIRGNKVYDVDAYGMERDFEKI
jgi:hypothetical protein